MSFLERYLYNFGTSEKDCQNWYLKLEYLDMLEVDEFLNIFIKFYSGFIGDKFLRIFNCLFN